MERKPKRYSSPKRNIYTAIPEIEEKDQSSTIENQNVKSHTPKKIPQKKKLQTNASEQRMELKKKFEMSAEGSGSRTLTCISESDRPVEEKTEKESSSTVGQLFHNEQSNTTSKLDSFGFTADGGDLRIHSFFPSIEKQPLYSMALDREKLKHSEFWPFDTSSDDNKCKSFPTPNLKDPLRTSLKDEKNLPCGKLKKNKGTSTFLMPILEAEITNVEKKVDRSGFDESKLAQGRKSKNQDSVLITDEKKGRILSPKHSRKKIKRSKSNSSEEPEKNQDQGKIKNLFSLLNITDKEKQSMETTPQANAGALENDVQEKRSISPIASFLNKINSSQRVFKSAIFDKANLPGDNLDLFPFPPPKSKDTIKNAIKASKTFIAGAGNKSSKNLLKVNKATNVSIKHSKHERKNKDLEGKKEDGKGNYYEINIHEKLDFTPSLVRSVGSSSFDSISKSEYDKLSDVNSQRPSSADMYKESPSRHGKRIRKQVTEHPSLRKVVDDKKSVSSVQSKPGEKSVSSVQSKSGDKTTDAVKVTKLNEKVQSSKLDEESASNKIGQILGGSVEGSSSAGTEQDNTVKFKNDNYIGVHVVQQGLERPLLPNVQFSNDQNSPVTQSEDHRIKKRIRDLIFYLVFLTLITLIASSMVSSNTFYFTDITTRLFMDSNSYEVQKKLEPNIPETLYPGSFRQPEFQVKKSLRNSVTIADFWLFAESIMIDLFYWKEGFGFENSGNLTERKFLFESVMLGVPRIRQVRVTDNSCHIHPDVSKFFEKCYGYYTIFSEDRKPINIDMENSATKTAWVFTPAVELGSSYYWGKISAYGGGGYYLDLSVTKEQTEQMLKELKSNRWISQGTRAVFIDFTIYNANANLFCVCKIILEFPPMGGMIPATDFTAVKLIRYLNRFDYFILGCEFVVTLFVIFYTYQEVIDLKNEKIRYFTHFWNYVDVVILALSYTYITLNILLFLQVSNLLTEIRNKIEEHIPFGSIAYTQTQFNNVIAVLVFFCWIKLFKYLNFNKTTIQLNAILSRCLKNVFGFALMFFTVIIAFAQLAYLLFGTQVKDYSNVWSSFMALFQTFLGEFEYKQIEEANRILGPVFYLVFVFFLFFILLNMYLAVVNDAYANVKSEVKVFNEPSYFGDYIKRAFLNIIGCSCCGLDKKLESKCKKSKKHTYGQVKDALKRAGYTDLEIDMFFTKYDVDINQLIEKGQNKRIIEDLETRRLDFLDERPTSDMTSLKTEIERLNDKISEMHRNLTPVIEKVDVLLKR